MIEPKFVPGERVLLESACFPKFNGEHVIESLFLSKKIKHATTGENLGSGFLYILDGITLPSADEWLESALRKLPPETPATFDASIWVPNKETVK